MQRVVLAVLAGVLAGCSSTPEPLEIRQYHLRDTDYGDGSLGVGRAERLHRLHGAVSKEERELRKGHYYTVEWDGPAGTEGLPVRIVLEYRQAGSGSEILRQEQNFPAARKGKAEFIISGEAYATGGRVLAWRLLLFRGGELAATRKSYLWE